MTVCFIKKFEKGLDSELAFFTLENQSNTFFQGDSGEEFETISKNFK